MTLDELIENLMSLRDGIGSGKTPVIMSEDAEGNGFSPVAEADSAYYVARSTWDGERFDPADGGVPKDGVPAVFLWPVN